MPKPLWILPALAYLAFISLGLPDTVLGVAWPDLRHGFGLSQSAIGAVLFAGTCGYFSSGLCAGVLMRRLGVGGLLAASSGLVVLALLGYATAPSWSLFFPVGIVMGLGSGAIDAGLNHYAAQYFSARSLNWLHACWGIGASLGPYIMAAAIARGHAYRGGYLWIAALLVPMAIAFLLTRRWWDTPAKASERGTIEKASGGASARAALRNKRVWHHLLVFLLYVGVESSVGQWCFTLMRETQGLSVEAAGSWTAAYWASLTGGRVLLGFVVDRIGPDRLLRATSPGVVLGTLICLSSEGTPSRLGLLVIGVNLAPFFPTLMARTPARVGAEIARYSVGFQVSAATLGAALVPASIGVIASRIGVGVIGIAWVCLALLLLLAHELLIHATRIELRAGKD